MTKINKTTENINNNLSIQKNNKNCKKYIFTTQKIPKNTEKTEFLVEKMYNTDLHIYIKVLLEAFKSIPNIISIIDRIIEQRASSLLPATSIYGTSYLSTIKEIDKVFDLGERKDKLLNLYVIIEHMLNCLNDNDKKFTELKFIQKNTTPELSKELNITERSIYRKSQKVIEKIGVAILKQNWSSEFIKSQIDEEPWLIDLFNKKKEKEITTNHHRQ